MIRVYVAGAYSDHGKVTDESKVLRNVHRAMDVAARLLHNGFVPFIPHLNHWWHQQHPQPNEVWMQYDLHWQTLCHVLYVTPGALTRGVKQEIAQAGVSKQPVYYEIERLLRERQILEARFFPKAPYHQVGTIPELMAQAVVVMKATACEECQEDKCWTLGSVCDHYCHGMMRLK